MTTQAVSPSEQANRLPRRPLGATSRRDRWWLAPVLTVTALTLFGVYSIIVAALNKNYEYTANGARYLSPFYSPDLRSLFGLQIPFTYAFFVIWAPLGLRLSCYYYRKAYYRSFFLTPPACAVAGRPAAVGKYTGETKFPWVLNNVHRLFFYFATIVVGFLWFDAIRAFFYTTPSGTRFGIGLGAVIMVVNVVLLSAFTFGCNSFRHLVGGRLDCFTCTANARARHGAWKKISILNAHHQLYAWLSMFSVGFTDLYIRLAAGGVFSDPHHIF